jgi:adenine deaminase
MISFDHLGRFQVKNVFKDGIRVAENGKMFSRSIVPSVSVKIKRKQFLQIEQVHEDALLLRSAKPLAKVIQLIPDQIVTKKVMKKIFLKDGVAYPDIKEDILKIAVVERHRATGNIGVGFVQGFGLKRGAIGSSVAHDSHNLVIVGTNDQDMLKVVTTIRKMGGGLVAVLEGKVLASLSLPIAGLMAEGSVREVYQSLERVHRAARFLGCKLTDPLMTLSFLSLPVIPELKLTDKGLVDVNQFKIVPVFGED